MYRQNRTYKIQLKRADQHGKHIQYTARIISEDDHDLQIMTKYEEEIILNKEQIRQSKLLPEDPS